MVSRAQFAPEWELRMFPRGRIQRLGGSILGGPGCFNTAAFCAIPTIGNGTGYGNSGVGIILGPGQFNWDMSLVKTPRWAASGKMPHWYSARSFSTHSTIRSLTIRRRLDVSKSTFGNIVTTSVSPRVIQFALKYLF